MSNLPTRPQYTYTEDDWIQIRAHFMGSILVDVHLHKLAQNIGSSWPIKEKEETPAKYLEYSFEELAEAPGIAGQSARLQLLLDILKETAAFDDPFQNMMEGKPDPSRNAVNTDQLLQKLAIPTDFPIDFTALSNETQELCRAEGAVTIGQCVSLLQGMAQNVLLSGEVRQLLNSLAHTDEKAIAEILPFRPGSSGVHLAEGIGLLIRRLPERERNVLVASEARTDARTEIERRLLLDLPGLLEWFPAEAAELRKLADSGQSLERFFHYLDDPALEETAARLVQKHFNVETEPDTIPQKRGGLLGRVATLFRMR